MKSREEGTKYVCDGCGERCAYLVSNGSFRPWLCPCGKAFRPKWTKVETPKYRLYDEWRWGFYDDDEFIAKLADWEKDAIVRNHFDCETEDGCPCMLDKEFRCMEFEAYCRLTGSDGSDFDYADCMFRCNMHRCLTEYVLWKRKKEVQGD